MMAGLGLIMFTSGSTQWPVYLFYVGLGLSLLAGVVYGVTVRSRMRTEARQRELA
jgi:hypothetical protein